MPLDPKRLRRLFATGAILTVVVAAFFYLRGILKSVPVAKLPKNIPANVERSGRGFTFSQSEGGKTLFTIRAASFEQFKEGGKAELQDVSIIVYGRDADRSDQIYGSEFSYDQKTGDISAQGEVHIDLDVNSSGASQPGQPPAQETKNVVHVKTSGLIFNKTSGLAHTDQMIEFRIPEATGSAVGATYDSHKGVLTLKSAVRIASVEKQGSSLAAQSATISKDPRTIVLYSARVKQPQQAMSADKVSILLRDDNSVSRIVGAGDVRASAEGKRAFEVTAPEGEVLMAANNQPQSGALSGGVHFESRGVAPARGTAGKLLISFAPQGRVNKVRLQDAVELNQDNGPKSQQIKAVAIDLFVKPGNKLEKAVTSNGPAQIIFSDRGAKPNTSTISAGQFEATFNAQNRLSSVFGSPEAKIVSQTPGQPPRIASGDELHASLTTKGQIAGADLINNFHYQEGNRSARADRAHYNAEDESFNLTGSPRIADSGFQLTANTIQLGRKAGSAIAQGDVKTTYNDMKPQPNGAMLASGQPVHVTGASVTATQGGGVAHYTAARLWQGGNIIEAPSLTFDKPHRSLLAQRNPSERVTSVFVSPGKNGASTPVNVTSDRLSYVDADRKAVFTGNVRLHGEDFTMSAATIQVLLAPAHQAATKSGNQLDRIVAEGDIQIQQPDRRATGSQLVYTASEQKFVLTGVPGKRPSIFDAERGQISGDSLTFYTHDGRVLIGSGQTSQSLTPTRIRDASTK
ncbi:MAG TPA: LPS export ABC transporter periplasmic protein LptC [Candidatus Acidoferrales bacterium]|nr:LPS export ABC transporter periplasmic protein LptC [Candidatus Acidoferrales bacterium]